VRYYDSQRCRRRWAQNLYAARLNRELTQAQLARALGVDQQNISRWERGRSAPRDDMKILLAKFFGVPVPELFPWVDDDANGDEGRAA
jgi:transcriptional regulator with XRE-family HTH domain